MSLKSKLTRQRIGYLTEKIIPSHCKYMIFANGSLQLLGGSKGCWLLDVLPWPQLSTMHDIPKANIFSFWFLYLILLLVHMQKVI